MKYLNNNRIFLLFITLLPIAFIGRFTLEVHFHNTNISLNYIYITLLITIILLTIKNKLNFLLSILYFFKANLKILFPILLLTLVDTLILITHKVYLASLITFIKRLAVYFLFIFTTYAWFNINDNKKKKKAINGLIKTWNIIFIFDILISIFQLIDCYFFKCVNMIYIQQFFTSSALPPNHQMFGYYSPKHTYHLRILRPPGIFGDTNYNGMFLVLSIILFFIEYINTYNHNNYPKNKIHALIFKEVLFTLKTILASTILILTFSRSAILGIIIFLPYLIIHSIKNIKILIKPILAILATIVLAIYILYLISPNNLSFITRRLNIKKDPSSLTHERLLTDSKKIIKKYPPKLLGNGLDSYNTLYQKTIRHTKRKTNPHSIWIQTYIEQGWLGIVALVILGTYLIIYTYKNNNPLKTFTKSTMLNLIIPYFLIVGIVYYGFFMPFVWAWGIIPYKKVLNKNTRHKLK